MAIQYALYKNHLTDTAGDYFARAKASGGVGMDGIAKQITLQGSTITQADVRAVLYEAARAIQNLLLNGTSVDFEGLIRLRPGIKGTFESDQDSYDRERHELNVIMQPDQDLLQALRQNADLLKLDTALPTPKLSRFVDNASGSIDNVLTPGMIGQLTGNHLEYNPSNTDEGIFLIEANTAAMTKVEHVQRNAQKEIVFLIPSTLPADTEYYLQVRSRVFGGQTVRSGKLEVTLQTPA